MGSYFSGSADIYMKKPTLLRRYVTTYRTAITAAPMSRQIPAQSCGPKKSDRCCFTPFPCLFNKAPAIGEPMSEANDEMPQLIPTLVPNREESGQRLGNTVAGSVTSPAEQNPQSTLKAIKPLWLFTAIQQSDKIPEISAQKNQQRSGPMECAITPAARRPKNDAPMPITKI